MRSFWLLPLRRQLLLANLLIIIPLIGLIVWSGRATLQERKDELARQARNAATATAAYLNRELQVLDLLADRLVDDSAVRALDAPQASARLSQALSTRPSIPAVLLVDATGREIARGGPLTDRLDTSTWRTAVERRGNRVVLPVAEERSKSPRFIVMAYPVSLSDGTAGALAFYVQTAALQSSYSELDLPDGSLVRIADRDGQILLQSVDIGLDADSVLNSAPRTTADPLGPIVRSDPDGVKRQYAEAVVEAGPWIVGVGMPLNDALDGAMLIWKRNLAILAFGLTGWVMLAWVLSRRLGESVRHLDAAAQRIALGDFSPLQHKPMLSAELSQLQRAFDGMLQRFNATRSALDGQMGEERRIRQELQSLQGQVIRQERLAAVGQLVSGVAHEINNPLQAILGFSELLQMQQDVPDSVKADLSLIQKESARACGIIRNLALFARQQPAEAAPMMMSDVIRAVAELRQRRLVSEDIELHIDDRAHKPVTAVLTELQQVVLNFVVNAEQAIIGSGRLPGRITIRSYDRDDHVILEVEDTGPGIPAGDEAKLFQPFFTTKPVGQGTGLGLSISYGIVESLGGVIGYRRAPAGGAIFYCDLPAAVHPDLTPARVGK